MAKKIATEKIVNDELVAQAFAKAVADGDIVNFRLLFASFSPARKESPERFETEKYAYLLPTPSETGTQVFREALDEIRSAENWKHLQSELAAKRPSQLPWGPVMRLGDNAVRLGKFSFAAQAYETLRIRRRMQALFLEQADAAVAAGDLPNGVRGYRIALGLSYDYAAFPEPLPLVPNHQTSSLRLHGIYPKRPEDGVAVLDESAHVEAALEYLLPDGEVSARARAFAGDTRLAFLVELVRQTDPDWGAFCKRYSEACALVNSFGERARNREAAAAAGNSTAEPSEPGDTPAAVMERLLGRTIEGGQWWQYLKELGYLHPASVLFIARQVIGEKELLLPRLRSGSRVAQSLGLVTADTPGA